MVRLRMLQNKICDKEKGIMIANNEWKYNGAFTREQFLFYEMRITAKLLQEGISDAEIIEKIERENLYQYKTEKSLKRMARGCLTRLRCMNSDILIKAIAESSSEVARQICLYAMMKQYRIVWDFMILVIGNKYQNFDMGFRRSDLNVFFNQLQEQDDLVAAWSENTIAKLKQVLLKLLVDNKYLDNNKSEKLNPVLISDILEQEIRRNNDIIALKAFNCLQ